MRRARRPPDAEPAVAAALAEASTSAERSAAGAGALRGTASTLGPLASEPIPKDKPPAPPLKPIRKAAKTGIASSIATSALRAAILCRHS